MLTVHHLGYSQSERVVWLCEELGIDYALKLHQRRADNRMAPDDYKTLHPMGIAPVITDGDLALGESGTICEYIARKHGGGHLIPSADDPDFADHLYWFHSANGTFMATQMMKLVHGGAESGALPPFVEDRDRRGRQTIEHRLGEAPFFGGRNLTLADIMMGFSLITLPLMGGNPIAPAYPNTLAYIARIQQRPAYRKAMEKAEPAIFKQLP